MKLISVLLLASLTFSPCAWASVKVCMVLDKGGKDDHSFNQSAVKGFLKAQKDFHLDKESKFVEPRVDAQTSLFFKQFSSQEAGCSLIIAIGFLPASHIPPVAKQHPDKKYLIVDVNLQDADVNHNMRSVTFEEHEGGFLMGAIAALKSKTGKIGFIGGMDVPLIHRVELGYESGAKFVQPNIKVSATYVGITPEAWNNPAKAKELAMAQYQNGTDVIFQVAAGSGQGVFDAAQTMNISAPQVKHLAIGVDANQNSINPQVILTSMEKRVDGAVYQSIKDVVSNQFTPGHVRYGLKEGGVQWSYDENNKKFFTAEDLKRIHSVEQGLILKKIAVPDYYLSK